MFGKHRKRRGIASVLGMALIAMLAFGAVAQASPAWHVLGKTLAELGKQKENVTMTADTVTFAIPSWGTSIKCSDFIGWGQIEGESSGRMHLVASKCSIPNNKSCEVEPIELDLALGLSKGGGTGVIETFTAESSFLTYLYFEGVFCSFPMGAETQLLSHGGNLGAEVTTVKTKNSEHIALNGSSSYAIESSYGSTPIQVTLSGEGEQQGAAPIGVW